MFLFFFVQAQAGIALQFCSEKLRDTDAVCQCATEQDPRARKYASAEWQRENPPLGTSMDEELDLKKQQKARRASYLALRSQFEEEELAAGVDPAKLSEASRAHRERVIAARAHARADAEEEWRQVGQAAESP